MHYNPKLRPQKKLIISEDGTHTLYSEEFGEPYHSTKDGALHESLEKHVKPAFRLKQHRSKLTILDICFGLGYNSFATLYWVKKLGLQTKVHILSPEFDEGLVRSLDTFQYPAEFDDLREIIQAVSRDFYYKDEQFTIEVYNGDAREIIRGLAPKNKFDIVYQDAFSPAHNPLLWTREWFRDIRAVCSDDAVLTTYSIASAVRLGLYENGFGIYLSHAELMRDATVASLSAIDGFDMIDMELKKVRNPEGKALLDLDYLE
jgi:tRNA U34 5-methylaminomethyl-2-thiouridine-forming methyltransferase MnmC